MKSILCLLPLAVAVLASTKQAAAEDPVKGVETIHGCYSSIGELTLNGTNEFNTEGLCSTTCAGAGFAVGASYSSDCYCGDKYPAESTLVDDSECNEPCPGYDTQACGGPHAYTVYNTGLKVSVGSSDDSSSSSASSSASTAAATGVSTASSAAATTTGSSSNGTATTGTTATSTSAVVVGTNAAAAQLPIIGLSLFGLGAAIVL
ncbi:hypothetical protein E8E14_009800 [Neopestalotiopsis sp. 37M]|nr:hypothetical protein E8E14_009800 [Neopestalotiopsis sp. 37M]